MSTQWLAVQSFQHNQSVLSAINTLSIHTKLGLIGITDEQRNNAAKLAKEVIESFIKELSSFISDADLRISKPVVGINPRLRQFAKNFMEAKRNRKRYQSIIFRKNIIELLPLLEATEQKDLNLLLQCLLELRMLLEEHMHVDTKEILGEI